MLKRILILVFSGIISLPVFASLEVVPGLEQRQIKKVALGQAGSENIYAASDNILFKSPGKDIDFIKLAVFKDEQVGSILVDLNNSDTVYVCASRNLYRFDNKGKERLFAAPEDETIFCLTRQEHYFYLGTSQGIYSAKDDLFKWAKVSGIPAGTVIFALDANKGKVCAATSGGIYVSSDGQSFERLSVIRDSREEENYAQVTAISLDKVDPNKIWVGFSNGLFVIEEESRELRKVFIPGFDNLNIRSLSRGLSGDVYAATAGGLLNTSVDPAKNQFEYLAGKNIYDIAINNFGDIYLATSEGLLLDKKDPVEPVINSDKNTIVIQSGFEPSIEELRKAAVKYNQVSPEKIQQWREAVKVKALLPKFSLNYDKTIYGSYSVSTTSRSGYGGAYVGPRDWGMGLSWDFSDLIWNSSETEIDSRAKLNTELRLDIIDELNRVYFERLRIKNELKTEGFTGDKLFQKQLRLQELTAILDGYTGGYFSSKSRE